MSETSTILDLRQLKGAETFVLLEGNVSANMSFDLTGDFRDNTFRAAADPFCRDALELEVVVNYDDTSDVTTVVAIWPSSGLGESGRYSLTREPNSETAFLLQAGEYFVDFDTARIPKQD